GCPEILREAAARRTVWFRPAPPVPRFLAVSPLSDPYFAHPNLLQDPQDPREPLVANPPLAGAPIGPFSPLKLLVSSLQFSPDQKQKTRKL
ncbi:hypothetical protein, partial [Acinetobacter baumannii]|uniref:hypothetical protein n=1 Tax=Acinetobacter baumannii TaxID=470 RepID=UPI00196ACC22